ncbi:DegT/DnrJ/EryC1/StrS family aminotransferase, partial [Gammaproteobacteria bacterium]|nr:DegT/DnrJ/EryC1/StrS family aminotransferase [Gammaproteobacteria bacterium]
NPKLALRLQAIRNHAENIVEPADISPVNMIGFNYRMTEMSAAVGLAQLNKIDEEISKRQRLAESLSKGMLGLEGITPPLVREKCRHVYYVWALRLNEHQLGISRESFSAALAAEGFPHFLGYVRPLYLLPVFQQRIAIGKDGWPFTLSNRTYTKGQCPVAEQMYEKELLCFEPCAYDVDDATAQKLVEAIQKVHANRHAL